MGVGCGTLLASLSLNFEWPNEPGSHFLDHLTNLKWRMRASPTIGLKALPGHRPLKMNMGTFPYCVAMADNPEHTGTV